MARLYIEGGGDSKELHSRCREAFRKLLERAGFAGRMPRMVACGSRSEAYDDFRTSHLRAVGEYVALLIDSEEPVADSERPWAHLVGHDQWERPNGAVDDQALLMITSMETWIACDHEALRQRFGQNVRLNALPPLHDIEHRSRADVFAALRAATRECTAVYAKGAIAFEVMSLVSPDALEHLPGFARVKRVLEARL